MITHELLEELIYNRLIEKDKLLDENLFNYDDFCFYCDKHLKYDEKFCYKTIIGNVVVCKDCLEKLKYEHK